MAILLLGGVVAVDVTSLGQFMISRPFVAATLAGWVVGAPEQGMAIGLVLEIFDLAVVPVGAAKYPEGGPAAVGAGAVYASADASPVTLLLVLLGALTFEWIGGESVRYLRQANVRIMRAENPDAAVQALESRHRLAIALDFSRGVVLVAFAVLLLQTMAHYLPPLWALDPRIATIGLAAAVVGMLASTIRLLGVRIWLAAAGAVLGFGLLLLNG